NANCYGDGSSNRDANCGTHSYGDRNSNWDTNSYSNCHCNGDRYTSPHSTVYANSAASPLTTASPIRPSVSSAVPDSLAGIIFARQCWRNIEIVIAKRLRNPGCGKFVLPHCARSENSNRLR